MNFNGLIRTVDFFREVHVLCEENEVYFQMSKLYLPTFLSYRRDQEPITGVIFLSCPDFSEGSDNIRRCSEGILLT